MAFVYEQLDSASMDALRKKIPAFHSILGFSPFQAIDRARDIVYVSLGGKGELLPEAGEPPDFHAVFWRGICVAFEGYETLEMKRGLVHLNIRLTKLSLPSELHGEMTAIKDAIGVAMTVYRTGAKGRPVSISIQFPPATTY